MILINAREPVYHRYEGGSAIGTVRLLVISAVVFARDRGDPHLAGLLAVPG